MSEYPDVAQARAAAERLTAAGFPASHGTAGYPAYGSGGGEPEEWDNDTWVVHLGGATASALVAVLTAVADFRTARGKRRPAIPAMDDVTDDMVRHVLLLCDRDVPLGIIARWSDRERFTACEWASLEYLKASDNPVRTVGEPWFVGVAAGIISLRAGAAP